MLVGVFKNTYGVSSPIFFVVSDVIMNG